MYQNEISDYRLEDKQRKETKCIGCGAEKSLGTVVCWDCWYGRENGKPAYKYYTGDLSDWIKIKTSA